MEGRRAPGGVLNPCYLAPVRMRRLRFTLVPVLVLGAGIVLSACGGDSSPEVSINIPTETTASSLSKADFITNADTACEEVNTAISQFAAAGQGLTEADQIADLRSGLVDQLKDLDPPDEDRATLDQFTRPSSRPPRTRRRRPPRPMASSSAARRSPPPAAQPRRAAPTRAPRAAQLPRSRRLPRRRVAAPATPGTRAEAPVTPAGEGAPGAAGLAPAAASARDKSGPLPAGTGRA